MTKTESANRTVQAVVIEACEQLLECQMAEGCRLAIPNTNNLIMVGPQEWIAENVLAVEAMVGREPAHIPQTADEVIAFIGNHYDSMEQRDDDTETRFQLSVHDLLSAFRWWFDTDLAATTQASTAQAEPGAWISVDERLPAKWKEVIVWPYPTDYCMTAELVGENASGNPVWKYGEYTNGWGHETLEITRPVTHWMPLPAAPSALRAGDTGEQADGGA